MVFHLEFLVLVWSPAEQQYSGGVCGTFLGDNEVRGKKGGKLSNVLISKKIFFKKQKVVQDTHC